MLEALQLETLHNVEQHFDVKRLIEFSATFPQIIHVSGMEEAVGFVGRKHPTLHLFDCERQTEAVLGFGVLFGKDVSQIAADFWPSHASNILLADRISRSGSRWWVRSHTRTTQLKERQEFAIAGSVANGTCGVLAVPVVDNAFEALQPTFQLV